MGQISDRELHEECGVFGVFGVKDAASLTYYGLHALQHRGQEGAGIVTVDRDATFRRIKGGGLVTEVFGEGNLSTLKGDMAIGHVRYTTPAVVASRTCNRSFSATTRAISRWRTTAISSIRRCCVFPREQGEPVPVDLGQRNPGAPDQEGDQVSRPSAHLFDHRRAEHDRGGFCIPDHDRQPHLCLP